MFALNLATSSIGRVLRNLETRRVAWQLRNYDDHALRDIGLTRGDVESPFITPFWSDLRTPYGR